MSTKHTVIQIMDDPTGKGRTPRCLGCGYRLVGLTAPVCPECGRVFSPNDPSTFSRRPPFVWYLYWWPGALLAVSAGLVWSVVFYVNQSLGWGLFIAVPFMIGALVGYRPSPKRRVAWVLARVVAVVSGLFLVALLMMGEFAGVFCGIMLILIFFMPILSGFYFGMLSSRALAHLLKHTRFSQREHLPLIFGLLVLPGLAHLAERAFAPPIKIQTIRTARVIDLDQDDAWDAWVFYEQVKHPRPVLLRLGLPTPSHVEGRIQHAGDVQVCVYTGSARLVKMATQVIPGRRLAFDVIGQQDFENNSIRLIDGSFDFKKVTDDTTEVTLTTRYEPLLRPRVVWDPIERIISHELHGHVLKGMTEPDGSDEYAASKGGRR